MSLVIESAAGSKQYNQYLPSLVYSILSMTYSIICGNKGWDLQAQYMYMDANNIIIIVKYIKVNVYWSACKMLSGFSLELPLNSSTTYM